MPASLLGGIDVAMFSGFVFLGTFLILILIKGGHMIKNNSNINNLTTGIISSLIATEIHQVW
jgi:hypothetical protein